MLELINTTSQTLTASSYIPLGSIAVNDNAGRMELSDATTINLNAIGKYKITGLFNVSNITSDAVNVTIEMYANKGIIGLPITVTVPATTGFAEIVVEKTVNVKPSTYGNVASIQFTTPTGATITGCQVDVFKRV